VDHVLRQTYGRAKVTVIDNGSRLDDVAVLRSELPANCELIRLPQNRGFAEGMNVALRQANPDGHEVAWLLNNDGFPASDWLEKLVVEFDKHPSLAILAARLVGIDGAEQHAGGQIRWTCGEHHLLNAEKLMRPPTWGSWLTGTAWLVRMEALRRVGLLDPRFF